MSDYAAFLAGKLAVSQPDGFEPLPPPDWLFPFQADLVTWACRRGRAALFTATGTGKTRMELAWADQCIHRGSGPVLILTPLAVAAQTQAEGRAVGVEVTLVREQADVRPGINVCNYERLHKIDPRAFGAVVCDESSLIKNYTAKTLTQLIAAFGATPYRLCATATPSPNDYTELGTHAEFLGICSRVEMLSEFFCHDGGETQVWRLKGHARRHFWRWVASWGALVRAPSDLGYDDGAYALPPLTTHHHVLRVADEEVFAHGELFPRDSISLTERRAARKSSISARVEAVAALVNADPTEPWLVFCGLNAESEALTDAIPGAVEVTGSMDIDEKESRLLGFAGGAHRVMVSKASIAGLGLNLQVCARIAYAGLSDSWEEYFQSVRRCWRFGQTRPVEVHIFVSELEAPVLRNVERKAADAEKMGAELSRETGEMVRASVLGQRRLATAHEPQEKLKLPPWMAR